MPGVVEPFGGGLALPRYHFDFEVGGNSYRDDQGVELESLEVARKTAARVIPPLILEELSVSSVAEVRLVIRDEHGRTVSIHLACSSEDGPRFDRATR